MQIARWDVGLLITSGSGELVKKKNPYYFQITAPALHHHPLIVTHFIPEYIDTLEYVIILKWPYIHNKRCLLLPHTLHIMLRRYEQHTSNIIPSEN